MDQASHSVIGNKSSSEIALEQKSWSFNFFFLRGRGEVGQHLAREKGFTKGAHAQKKHL